MQHAVLNGAAHRALPRGRYLALAPAACVARPGGARARMRAPGAGRALSSADHLSGHGCLSP
ncbi:hypothetical protein C7S16_4475 [Burkholderia thailandensis]|uniref:Uncharacterized protein n=1 Tax=Burkholderia thailandensis TaxID=57975 RepID=A0AAW9CTF0_BURTH|nr:hypothetical protein [Burkholderia thailandensis]MDW9252901.1 hypothetical protein [Burkholderia thailandensis]